MALALLSIGTFGLTMSATRNGSEVNDDSILYVAAAQNILAGNGFSWLSGGGEVRPITGFPPAYSVVIAAAGLTGVDLFEGARWVNAILFGLSVFLVGYLLVEATGSGVAAVVGALLLVFNADVQLVYRWIMAEALFVPLLLLSILLLSAHLRVPRWPLAALSGLAVGLAMLTRYVGVGLLPGAILGVLLLSDTGWGKRLRDSLLVGAVASVPFLILTVVNYSIVGSAFNREAIIGAPRYATLVTYLNEVFSWFVPMVPDAGIRLRWKVLALILFLVVAPLLLHAREKHGRPGGARSATPKSATIPPLALFLSLGYLAVLVMAISGGDVKGIHLQRYMAPVYVSWVVLAIAVIHRVIWCRRGMVVAKIGAVTLAVFYLGWYGNQGVLYLRDGGEGPNRDDYRRANPATVEKLEQLDPSESIYTNEVYLVYYLTYRPSYRIPTRQDLVNDKLQEGAGGQFSLFRSRMAEGAYLVLFDSIRDQGGTFPAQELTMGLVRMAGIAEGAVFVDPNAHPVAGP